MNVLAVLLAVVVNMAIGFAYYHPRVLGTRWLAALGKDRSTLGEPVAGMVASVVGALVGALALATLLDWTGLAERGILGGVALALLVWAGFMLTTHSINSTFKGDDPRLTVIDLGYHLAAYLAMGVVLGAWT